MREFPAGTTGRVIQAYQQPYPDPIRVRAGDQVYPDPSKKSEWPGWVWCRDAGGKAGWVPQTWLAQECADWRMRRDYDAIELTVQVGDSVNVELAESGFFWVSLADGRHGWVPESHVQVE